MDFRHGASVQHTAIIFMVRLLPTQNLHMQSRQGHTRQTVVDEHVTLPLLLHSHLAQRGLRGVVRVCGLTSQTTDACTG